jgi:hypothetical protein
MWMIKKCGYGSCAVGVDDFARKRNGRHAHWASNWAPRYIPLRKPEKKARIDRVIEKSKEWKAKQKKENVEKNEI